MWLINKWDSQTIDVKTEFLNAVIEEEIYMKLPEGMAEVLEKYYTYKYILTLIKYIHSIIQTDSCWFKEKIKTMTFKLGLKQCKTDICLLYVVNELVNVVVIICIYDTLEI